MRDDANDPQVIDFLRAHTNGVLNERNRVNDIINSLDLEMNLICECRRCDNTRKLIKMINDGTVIDNGQNT